MNFILFFFFVFTPLFVLITAGPGILAGEWPRIKKWWRNRHVSRDFDNYCSVDYAGYFDVPDGLLGPAVLPAGRPSSPSPENHVAVSYSDW